MRAFHLDTDNICNFKPEYSSLINDVSCDDKIFLYYTIDGHKVKAENSIHKLGLDISDNIVLIKCNQGKNSLDNEIISFIENNDNIDEHIIISNDKGYDDIFSGVSSVSRRGTSSTFQDRDICITKSFNHVKMKIGRLEQKKGKYIIACISPLGKHIYFQDRTIKGTRRWTNYLDGAEAFDTPEEALKVDTYNINEQVIVYVSNVMIDKARQGLYEWFYHLVDR